jgi:hypothetical protein
VPAVRTSQDGPKLQSPITIGSTMKLQRGSDQHMIFRIGVDGGASSVDASAPGINTGEMPIVGRGG